MSTSIDKLIEKLNGWWESFLLMLPNLLIALVVMVASVFVGRLLRKLATKIMRRFSNNSAVIKLMSNIITVVVFIAGFFIALGILHLDKTVTSLLAGAGVVGLAISLAFQEPILNVISGVMMSMREPFKIGDMVESNGFFGHITQITLRSTRIKKFSGEDVIIPNKMVLQNPIENYSLTNYRRVEIPCGVGYGDDLEKVEEVALKAVKDNLPYDKDRPVDLIYTEFGDSSINFILRFWLDMVEQKNFLEVKSKAIKLIKKTFDENDINIPFPIRTLDFSGNKGTIEEISNHIKTESHEKGEQ